MTNFDLLLLIFFFFKKIEFEGGYCTRKAFNSSEMHQKPSYVSEKVSKKKEEYMHNLNIHLLLWNGYGLGQNQPVFHIP